MTSSDNCTVSWLSKMGATYLNIELEVRASYDLKELCAALGPTFVANYCDSPEPSKFFLSGSIVLPDTSDREPDCTAVGLCHLVEHLSCEARKLWDEANDRVFDIGLDANLDRRCIVDLLASETLARMAKIGVRLAVSVYALDLENRLNATRMRKPANK